MRLGTQIDKRFKLTKGPIRGGTGEIWVAYDKNLGRSIVLKRALLGDDSATGFDRLKAEARALARFSHPHVVTLYDAVRVRTRTRVTSWLVLEYVPGGSLDRWPRILPESAARIGAQIADALAALHAEGIVHCDVKPGNLVVTENGVAKLTDFGAAYRIDGRTTITPNGAISHTPVYAAPEVIRGRPEPASDVFSLGVTLATLISGKPVRRGAPDGQPDDHEMPADVGPLREVLAAMLRAAPEERPDAAEARRLLDEVAGTAEPQLPLHAVPTLAGMGEGQPEPEYGEESTGRVSAVWRGLTTFAKRRPRVIAAGAIVVALAVVLSATWLIPDEDHSAGASRPPKNPAPRSLIGEPHAADPCALTDPAPLGKFGKAELDNGYGDFDRCDVIVRSGQDSVVDVEVDLNNGTGPEQAARKTVGRIRIAADPPSNDSCQRTLLLPAPDSGFNIDVVATSEKGSAPLCAMADVATSNAVKVLNQGQIARRSPPLPANSLAHQDTCSLLGANALNIVPGINASNPKVGFGGWDCQWQSTTKDIHLDLHFDRNQPLTAADGNPTQLRGYRTFITPKGDGADTCVVRVVYREYNDQNGQKAIEMLYVVVEGVPSIAQRCSMATKLADSAAAAVPRP